MQIHGFNKTTLLDYPEHLAATIFTGRCNFRCPFCHNSTLVLAPTSQPAILEEDIIRTLQKRKGILEGVCITGGEPTLQTDLIPFIESIKELGLKIKLDTNGYNPNVLKTLIDNQLIDYAAMDIKNSPGKYSKTAGVCNLDFSRIEESAHLLINSSLDYEFRTTVVREYHTEDDFILIGNWLNGARTYYLQAFKQSDDVITMGLNAHNKSMMYAFAEILRPFIVSVSVRGMD